MTNNLKADVTDHSKRAVLYLRACTKDGHAITAQRLACRQRAEELGCAVAEEFVDAGKSALSADRPELQRMLAYVEAEQVDVLIIHNIDRLARNRMDVLMITTTLEKAGVQLVSCSEQIDDKAPAGNLTHNLMTLIAGGSPQQPPLHP